MNNTAAKKPKESIKIGDRIQLGNHVLMRGDARNPEHVAKLVGNEKISLICVDPPYGVSIVQSKKNFKQYKKRKNIENDDITSEADYKKFTASYLKPIIPFLEKKNTFYLFNSDRMLIPTVEGIREAGYKFSQLLVWVKSQSVIGRLDYQPQHELILYGWYGRHAFRKSKDKSVIFCPKVSKAPLHPTMKPVSLLGRLILNSSGINEVVYDCFAGSGSIAIACEQTCRKALMMEIDEEYCQTIIDRYEKFTGKKHKFLTK